MRMMTQVLRPDIGKFIVVYFDDILVDIRTTEEIRDRAPKTSQVMEARIILDLPLDQHV